jgi:hypothetical protein
MKSSTFKILHMLKTAESCRRFVCGIVILCSAILAKQSFAEDIPNFTADGQLEVSYRSRPNDPWSKKTWTFSADILKNRYRIRMFATSNTNDYYSYTFENGEMYTLYHLTNKVAAPGLKYVPTADSPDPGFIEHREIPPNDSPRCQFVWLALASNDFFERQTNRHTMLPIWIVEDPKTRTQPFEMQIYFERLNGKPRLPASVSFINDGVYRSYNPATGLSDIIPLKPPYDKGFTNALYQVISTKTSFGLELPEEFLFVAYSTPIGNATPFELLQVHGWIASVGQFKGEEFNLHAFKGNAQIYDYRVSAAVHVLESNRISPFIAYPVTNGAWLSEPAVARVRSDAELRMQKQLQGQVIASRVQKRTGLYVFLGLLLFSPPVLLWLCRRSQAKDGK